MQATMCQTRIGSAALTDKFFSQIVKSMRNMKRGAVVVAPGDTCFGE